MIWSLESSKRGSASCAEGGFCFEEGWFAGFGGGMGACRDYGGYLLILWKVADLRSPCSLGLRLNMCCDCLPLYSPLR